MILRIYRFTNNIICLILARQSVSYKVSVGVYYFYYSLLLLFPFFPKPKSIKVGQYKLNGFDFNTLIFLFGEVFVKNEYYFSTKIKNPIILDCGSNIGASILYFKQLYPGCKIYAFEPDPETFEKLQQNVTENKIKNVSLFNEAVSNKNGSLKFYVDDRPGDLTMSVLQTRMSKRLVKVKSMSLSKFLKGKIIHFMKMDIEGGESNVFKDLIDKSMLSNIREFIIEYHHNIPGEQATLSTFLDYLEKSNFSYQIEAQNLPHYEKNKFQDILIYGFKSEILS